MLHIRWSKVIKSRWRTLDLPLPRLKDNKLCPVQAIFICLQLFQGASLDGPAFVYKLNGRLKSLTCEVFISRVRDCLALCDINPIEIASHSILRCGATFCYSVGLQAITLLGYLLSSCYQTYTENDDKARFSIIRSMQMQLHTGLRLPNGLSGSGNPLFSYPLHLPTCRLFDT